MFMIPHLTYDSTSFFTFILDLGAIQSDCKNTLHNKNKKHRKKISPNHRMWESYRYCTDLCDTCMIQNLLPFTIWYELLVCRILSNHATLMHYIMPDDFLNCFKFWYFTQCLCSSLESFWLNRCVLHLDFTKVLWLVIYGFFIDN